MKNWIAGLLAGLLPVSVQAEVTVTNLVASQVAGTKLVDITYDISSTETNMVKVSLKISNGQELVACPSVSGDIGDGVLTGIDKTVIWDVGADWNGNVATLTATIVPYDLPPDGGDPNAESWEVVSEKWVKNTYANGDVTMSDRTNDKMWLYYANPCGRKNWSDAMAYCEELSYAGYTNWILPDSDSLFGQYWEQGYFSGVQTVSQTGWYWSRSLDSYNPADYAIRVSMAFGSVDEEIKTYTWYVWPLRARQAEETVSGVFTTFNADTRDYTLVIATEQSTTTPSAGVYTNYCWQSVVTCSVHQVEVDNEWFIGWSGEVETNHTGATIVFALTNLSNTVTAHYSGDVDGDGLANTNEATYGTNPWLADSDGDGLDDYQELYTYSTDPLIRDMDSDGLSDGEEILTYYTNPQDTDTDSDGFEDGFEVSTGFDPTLDTSTPDLHSNIRTAIEFEFYASTNSSYRIEATEALSNTWEIIETPIANQGPVVQRFYSIKDQPKRYFRARKN